MQSQQYREVLKISAASIIFIATSLGLGAGLATASHTGCYSHPSWNRVVCCHHGYGCGFQQGFRIGYQEGLRAGEEEESEDDADMEDNSVPPPRWFNEYNISEIDQDDVPEDVERWFNEYNIVPEDTEQPETGSDSPRWFNEYNITNES